MFMIIYSCALTQEDQFLLSGERSTVARQAGIIGIFSYGLPGHGRRMDSDALEDTAPETWWTGFKRPPTSDNG
jgi:hypothetical protein